MKKLMIILIGCLLSFCGCQKESNTYTQMSMSDALKEMEKSDGYILLDVRRNDEYAAGHIKGAINISNEAILRGEVELLSDKNQKIYVYCRSGNRSLQSAKKLSELGFTNMVEIGGILDYSGELEK